MAVILGFTSTMIIFYLDCLRKSFKEEVDRQNLNCSLPWIQSMLGEIGHNSTKKKSCNNAKDFQMISLSGLQFAKQIAENKAPNCPGIYKHTLIHVYLQTYYFLGITLQIF